MNELFPCCSSYGCNFPPRPATIIDDIQVRGNRRIQLQLKYNIRAARGGQPRSDRPGYSSDLRREQMMFGLRKNRAVMSCTGVGKAADSQYEYKRSLFDSGIDVLKALSDKKRP
jgi:hypothetical protein